MKNDDRYYSLAREVMSTLADIDVHVVDANLLVYGSPTEIANSMAECLEKVDSGDFYAVIEVDAILGDDVWRRLEATDRES